MIDDNNHMENFGDCIPVTITHGEWIGDTSRTDGQ